MTGERGGKRREEENRHHVKFISHPQNFKTDIPLYLPSYCLHIDIIFRYLGNYCIEIRNNQSLGQITNELGCFQILNS